MLMSRPTRRVRPTSVSNRRTKARLRKMSTDRFTPGSNTLRIMSCTNPLPDEGAMVDGVAVSSGISEVVGGR